MQECTFDEDLLCVDSLEIFKKINEEKKTNSSKAIDEFLNTDLKAVQRKNEKTPSKIGAFAVISRDPDEKPSAAKRLFMSPTTSSSPATTSQHNSQSSTRISFKLTDIYQRLYGNPPKNAHNADADTMHLLMCAIATQNEFVKLADAMAIKFSDIK